MAERYSIYSINLNSAGELTVDGLWSLVRFLDAVDSTGDIVATAKISVKAERDQEAAPLRLGQAFLNKATERWVISWTAQAGITATLGFAQDPAKVDWDADPPVRPIVDDVNLSRSSAVEVYTPTTIAAAGTAAFSGGTSRRRRWLQNLSDTVTLHVGGTGGHAPGATLGYRLAPGQSLELATTGTVNIYNPGSVAADVCEIREVD